jgi:hypothetical protein
MKIKKGVILEGMKPPTLYAAGVCDQTWDGMKRIFVMSSGLEGVHPDKRNIHGNGWAFDIRTRDLPKWQVDSFALMLKHRLDPLGFDVVVEGNHIHIEYDPKGNENWIEEVD